MSKSFKINQPSSNLKINKMQNDSFRIEETFIDLSPMIEEVSNRKDLMDKQSEKVIAVDVKNYEIFYGWPIFTFGRTLKYYRVSLNQIGQVKGHQCFINDLDTGSTIQFKLDCQANVIPDHEGKAVLLLVKGDNPPNTLHKHLASWVKQFAYKSDRFSDHYFQLENELIAHLKQKGIQNGLSLKIRLTPVVANEDEIKEFSLIKHRVEYEIKKTSVPIVIIHTLAMNLIDRKKFSYAQIADLKFWVKEKLEQITQNILIQKTYAEVLTDFEEEEVKNKMEAEASKIGFSISQLLLIPGVEEIEMLENFDIAIDENAGRPKGAIDDNEELIYATKDARINVRLGIIVNGKVESLRGRIERYLSPDISLKTTMRKEIIRVTRQFIHGVDPERIYMHFNLNYNGEPSFQDELSKRITGHLVENFNATDLSITVKQLSTELTTRFQHLQSDFPAFSIQNFVGDINFNIRYKVKQVAPTGWFRFKANSYQSPQEELNAISSILKEEMELHLNTILPANFSDIKNVDLINYISNLFKVCSNKIVENFGLIVDLVSRDRKITDSEILNQKKRLADFQVNQLKNNSRLQQAKELLNSETKKLKQLQEELELAELSEDPFKIEELKEQIEEIKKKVMKGADLDSKMEDLESNVEETDYSKYLDQGTQMMLPDGDAK